MKKIIIIFLILFSVNGFSQISKNGLVAWYPFTGNAIDSSGSGNNGIVSGATLTTDRFGKKNCAYNFNGLSDNILIGNFSNWDMYKSNFTLSIWFETNDTIHTREQMLIGKDSACYGEKGEFRFEINEWGGSSPYNNISFDGTGLTGNSNFRYFPLSNKKVWVHTTITKLNNISYIYVNGKLVSTYSNYTTPLNGAINFNCYIGARLAMPLCATNSKLANFFWGKLDDIRIYNRALDSLEVKALYHEGGYDINNYTDTIIKIKNDTIIKHDTIIKIKHDTIIIVKNDTACVCNSIDFKVYPNPTKNYLNIDMPLCYINDNLYIYDMLGRIVFTQKSKYIKTKLDISNLSSGCYILRINSKIIKFIKI